MRMRRKQQYQYQYRYDRLSWVLLIMIVIFLSCRADAQQQTVSSLLYDATTDKDDTPAGGRMAMKREAESNNNYSESEEPTMEQLISFEGGVPLALLSNQKRIPLVGLGVGNLQNYLVPLLIASAEQDDKRIRLIDTAHEAGNERLVSQGIIQGMDRYLFRDGGSTRGDADTKEQVTVHVVTKVWYTHLGYERTKISVEESFQMLDDAMNHPRVDLRVHILLHWPRCYDSIPWMNCEQDEQALPDYVKAAGPPPHLDKNNAWKHSWRALEDMYVSQDLPIESIGVANFPYSDLQSMDTFAQFHPHVLQLNVWSLMRDPMLVDFCQSRKIHIQVFNVLSGIVTDPDKAPRAFHHLQKVAIELSEETPDDVTPAQVVLAWLIQHGVSVIPRTSRLSRLQENSVVSLSQIPELNDIQVEIVAHAVEAYLSGEDLKEDIHVSVTFHAPPNKNIMLFWKGHDGQQVHVAYIEKGTTYKDTSYPGHGFRLYDAQNKDVYIDYDVKGKFGETEHFHAEL